MRIDVWLRVVLVDGRVSITAHTDGMPSNTMDLLVDDSHELEVAIATVQRAVRRQITRKIGESHEENQSPSNANTGAA